MNPPSPAPPFPVCGSLSRRDFLRQTGAAAAGLLCSGAGGTAAPPAAGSGRLQWRRADPSRLFTGVSRGGAALTVGESPGLLDAGCRVVGEEPFCWLQAGQATALHGPLRAELRHRLHQAGRGLGEDLLEATLTVRNTSRQPQLVELVLATSLQPSAAVENQQAYLPLNAAGLFADERFAALGVKHFLQDCRQPVGSGGLAAHYLEPLASYPSGARETTAPLLAPVVDLSSPGAALRVALGK